jgi:hypothetical protein
MYITKYIIVLIEVILIIVGQAGGNQYTNKGGGSNYLCLPMKRLPGIMRTDDFPLRLHTAHGTSLSCKLSKPDGLLDPEVSYSAPYSTSLAYVDNSTALIILMYTM